MRRLIIILLLFMALGGAVSAQEYEYELSEQQDIYGELTDSLQLDCVKNAVPEKAREFIYKLELSPTDPLSFDTLLSKDGGEQLMDWLGDTVTAPIKQAAVLVTAILLCSLLQAFSTERAGSVLSVVNITGVLVCALCVTAPLTTLIMRCCDTLVGVCTFMNALIPIFAGILVAAMRAKTALGFQPAVFVAIQSVSALANHVVLPFSSMFLALSVSASCSGEQRLLGIAEIVKKAAVWIMSISMTVYISVFSIKNIISCSLDSAGGRAARFLVSSMIPIVGVSVNEALSSMRSCVGILKNTVGLYAVIVVLCLLVPLIIELIFWKLTLLLCSSGAKMLCVDTISRLLDAMGSMISIMLSVIICTGVMFVFTLTVITIAGGSV